MTIVANDDSPLESNIFFVADDSITFNIPTTLKTSGDYELQPNKAYRLSICDNILTVEAIVSHYKIPVENLLDNPYEITGGYIPTGGSAPTAYNDFAQITIEVEPNQVLWLDSAPTALVVAFLDENKTVLRAAYIIADADGKTVVPSTASIKYMSYPSKANMIKLRTITEERFDPDYGNLPTKSYQVATGSISSITETANTSKWAKIYNTSKSTYSSVTNGWNANYVMTNDALCCWDGYLLLGFDSNYRALGIGRDGKMYIFNNTTYTEQTQFENFSLPSEKVTVASNLQKSITPYRVTFGSTSVQIRDYLTNEIVQELSYADIDSHLIGGETYSSFSTHYVGCVWMQASSYPSGWNICAWKSTLPIVKYTGEDPEPETNPDLIDTWWRGKEWYAYGTSMTDATYSGYAVKLAAMTGMNIHNYGKGGSGIIPSIHGTTDTIKTRCMRTSDGKANADLITVEVIPNDMSGTLGVPTDTGDDTFLGNLNQIIQYLQENCPKAQIVILSATRSRRSLDGQTENNPQSEACTKWLAWEDGIQEVCRRNCIQYWEGGTHCGLGYHRVKAATSSNTYVRDNIHLTDVGAENLAYYFLNQLKNLPLWHPTYDL